MGNHFIYRVLILLLLASSFTRAQDTLYYQRGNIEIGKIIAIDSLGGKVAFQGNEGPVRVMLFSNLSAIGFDSTSQLDKDFFNSPTHNVKRPQSINQSNDLLFEERTKYGLWMIQIDALSPFFDAPSPFLNASNAYPYNSSIGIGVEYFVTERLGLSAMSRVGTGKQSFSEDTIRDLYFFKVPFIPELLFEVNLSSRIYPGYQRVFSPYFAPFLCIGSLRYYHLREFFRYEDQNSQLYEANYSILLEKRTESYFQFGLALGFLLNITQNINLSTQLNVVSTNATTRSRYQFEAIGNSIFNKIYADYDKPRQINMNGQIFLAYRLNNPIKKPVH